MFVEVSAQEEQQRNIKDGDGKKKNHLFIPLCCLISLRGVGGVRQMRSSKENRGESILAQLTEIKRLRRALAGGVMEYGISQPAW